MFSTPTKNNNEERKYKTWLLFFSLEISYYFSGIKNILYLHKMQKYKMCTKKTPSE